MRSAHFGKNGDWDESRRARVFLCDNPDDFSATLQQPISLNLATKRTSVSRRGIRKDIFENFYFRGYLPPKFEIENRSYRRLTQSKLLVMGYTAERYCLLHVVDQGPDSFRGPINFFCTMYGCGASKLPNFRILAYFLYKTPKTYLPVTSLQPRGYIAE